MKLISYINNTIKSLYKSLKRFPVTIALLVVFVVMMIYTNEIQPIHDRKFMETLSRINMIIALGVPLSLCIKLFFEKRELFNKLHMILSYCTGAIILILYYFFLLKNLNMVTGTRYAAVSIALYLAFFYIPYLPNREDFELYVIKVFGKFFTTVIYSAVLYAGLSAILLTIDKLLGVKIDGKIYYYTFLIVGCIFAPSYFLAGIPNKQDTFNKNDYPNIFRVLVLYIIMPLIAVYTTILYIYFAKIIITRQWPVGLVSHLVLWYSVISAGVLFFISPIYKDNTWTKKFIAWFPKILLPLLILMFFSIGIRIKAYGITENRYYVIILSLWVSGVMIYFSTNKKLRNIILPLSLSIIVLISVFGPLSSYSVSKFSQNKRFEVILKSNNMLNDGKILKAPSSITEKDKNEISRILDYFNSNHSLKDVKYLPGNFKIEDMEKVFGFTYLSRIYYGPQDYFYYNLANTDGAIDISGYNYLFDSRYFYSEAADTSAIKVRYDYPSGVLKIQQNGKEIYSKNINDFVAKIVDKYGLGDKGYGKGNALSPAEMSFEDENAVVKLKIQFVNISGSKNPTTGKVTTNEVNFYVLMKMK